MVNYIEYTTHNTQKSLVNALRHLKTIVIHSLKSRRRTSSLLTGHTHTHTRYLGIIYWQPTMHGRLWRVKYFFIGDIYLDAAMRTYDERIYIYICLERDCC
jgi:hypothetical protein